MTRKEIKELIERIERIPSETGTQSASHTGSWNQKRFLYGAFRNGIMRAGFHARPGRRKIRACVALAIAALLPDSPLHRDGFECAAVASSFNQALLIGRSVKTSLEILGFDFGKYGEFRVKDSQNLFEIISNKSRARFRVYGSDSKRAHGIRPNLIA